MTHRVDASTPILGGCLCRAVRYRISAPPLASRQCWCRLCQYLGAGSATVNVCFPAAAVEVVGETHDFVSVADSGNRMHRQFCPRCGTALFSAAEVRPHLLFVRAGSLDDPELGRPQMSIWTGQAPRWACIDPQLPSLPGQPPPAG